MVLRLKWLIVFYLLSTQIGFAKNIATVQFKKVKIQLVQNNNKKLLLVDMAQTPDQHAYGLMFREKLKADEGMLFIFEDEQIRNFWMKNTLVDLDIAYIDKNKKIIDIQQMKAVISIMQNDLPTYPSKRPAMYALEMPQGWFKKNKFSEGATLKIQARP